jgi:hypothetical protein
MTPLSPARRAAEDFERVIDGARGDVADRYSDLLTCVEVLRAQDIPAPRADFVADLRMRLMDAADTLLTPADAGLAPVVPLHVPTASRRQRRISIAAAAFVVIGGTAGVAAASENALPGDPLYPVKRGLESAQVSLNSSDSGKGQDLLRQASTRLDEVGGLIADGNDSEKITSTLKSFKSSAADGADKLFVAYQTNGDPEEITRLRTMIGSQLAKLESLAPEAPNAAKTAFEAARSLLGELDQQASVLCGDCGGPSGIASTFGTASSAPSLATLLNAPAIRAQQAADQAQRNADLANKAGNVAKDTPQGTPTTVDQPAPPLLPRDPISGLPLPTTPGNGDLGPLGGLTSGVSTLLKGVGSGTPLAPLTDAVDQTLESLTRGLLGPLPKQ